VRKSHQAAQTLGSKREKRYGISTEDFLKALRQGRLAETNTDFANRGRDCQELQALERMPSQYEDELKKLN